jgi:hypothetical protein
MRLGLGLVVENGAFRYAKAMWLTLRIARPDGRHLRSPIDNFHFWEDDIPCT